MTGRITGTSVNWGCLIRSIILLFGVTATDPVTFGVVGLLLAAPIWLLVSGEWPQQWVPSSPALMAVAGLLTEMEDRLDIVIEDDDVDGEMLEKFGGLLAFAEAKVIEG